jgi:poly(3-hydroxyalkanoate) synthetase
LNNLRKLERVNLIAGGEDDITPMDHVFDLCRYVHANLYLIEGAGHIGVFMGSNGLKDVWKYIFSNQIGNVYEKLSIA